MKSDMKSEAKLKMLQHMKKMATDMMGGELKGKMDGLKKVTVAAPDEKSLRMGLDKAKQVLPEMDKMAHDEASEDGSEGMDTDESASEEAMETPHEEAMEESSPEELHAKIKELQAKLDSMKK